MENNESSGGDEMFTQYRRLFISELARLEDCRKDIDSRVTNNEKELAVLKTKMLLIGTIAGALMSAVVSLAIKFLR